MKLKIRKAEEAPVVSQLKRSNILYRVKDICYTVRNNSKNHAGFIAGQEFDVCGISRSKNGRIGIHYCSCCGPLFYIPPFHPWLKEVKLK